MKMPNGSFGILFLIALLMVFVEVGFGFARNSAEDDPRELKFDSQSALAVRSNYIISSKKFKRALSADEIYTEFSNIYDQISISNWKSAVETLIKVLEPYADLLMSEFTENPNYKALINLAIKFREIIVYTKTVTDREKKEYVPSQFTNAENNLKELMISFEKFTVEDGNSQISFIRDGCHKVYPLNRAETPDTLYFYHQATEGLKTYSEPLDLIFFYQMSIRITINFALAGLLQLACREVEFSKNLSIWVQGGLGEELRHPGPLIVAEVEYIIEEKKKPENNKDKDKGPNLPCIPKEQLKGDIDELMKTHQNEGHHEFASRTFQYLNSICPEHAWFVGSYNETYGWNQHTVINWRNSLFIMRKHGRSLILGTPHKHNSTLMLKRHENIKDIAKFYRGECFPNLMFKPRKQTEYENLCLNIVNELTGCLGYEKLTMTACVKVGNGLKAKWNIDNSGLSFREIGDRIAEYPYYLKQFDLGTLGEYGQNYYTVIWMR